MNSYRWLQDQHQHFFSVTRRVGLDSVAAAACLKIHQMGAAVQEFKALQLYFESVFRSQEDNPLIGDDELPLGLVIDFRRQQEFLRTDDIIESPAGISDKQPGGVDLPMGGQRREKDPPGRNGEVAVFGIFEIDPGIIAVGQMAAVNQSGLPFRKRRIDVGYTGVLLVSGILTDPAEKQKPSGRGGK